MELYFQKVSLSAIWKIENNQLQNLAALYFEFPPYTFVLPQS